MGTRAVIRFGKTRIATHWDGDPPSLGKELAEITNPTLEKIVAVANRHNIDFATKDVVKLTEDERFENIAKKSQGKWTAQQLKDLFYKEHKQIQFGIQTANDYPIGSFRGYDDGAEFEYDVQPMRVMYRELHGCYREAVKKANGWKPVAPIITH